LQKVEEEGDDEEEIRPPISGGYPLYKDIMERNKNFRDKMLKAQYRYNNFMSSHRSHVETGTIPEENS
jgi:hypothetical protein